MAFVTAGALVLGGGWSPATALPSDDSEALASLIDTDLLGIDALDLIQATAGNPSDPGPATTTIDAAVLDGLVGLSVPGISLPLVGDGGLLDLGGALDAGVLNEYASAPDATHATAASGAVNNTGAIDVSGVADPTSTDLAVVDLTELLDQAGVAGLTDAIIDQASLGLGALASTASQEAGEDPTSEYLLAGAQLRVRSPLVGTLQQAIVDSVDEALEDVIGPGGTLQTALDAVSLPGVDVLGLVTLDLGDPTLDVSVDVAGAVDAAIAALPQPGGLVGVDLDTGLITIDLAELHAGNLNGLDANTPLLTGPELTQITNTLAAVLGDVTDAVAGAVRTALMSAAVTLTFTPTIDGLGGTVSGTVGATVSTTLGDLLTDSVEADDVNVVGELTVSLFPLPDVTIDAGALADAIVDPILTTLLPEAVAPLEPLLGASGTIIETAVGGAAATILATLDPVLSGVLANVLRVTVNSQSEPGELGADSFTVRPLLIELLPALTDTSLALASSSVRVAAGAVPTAPTVASVTPAEGPTSGGTVVTITGTNLDEVTEVTFGGVPGTDLTVSPDGTSLTVTTPATETAGDVEVEVTSPDGSDTGTFTYVAPTIGSISPAQGPEAGGTTVTITGTGLGDATDVSFGGVPAASFTVVDDSTITAVTPAGTGVVDVTVTLPGADATAEDGFAYLAAGAPAVDSVTPDEGPTSGGTTVTITGTNLGGVTAVTFDGQPATIVSNPDDTTLVVQTPPGEAGPADIVITNGDAVTGDLPGGFTYLEDGADATVTGIDPTEVSTTGGTTVTITGTDLDGATGVTFDGVPGTVVSADGTTIVVVAPASETEGPVDVAVVFPAGETDAGTVTYVAPEVGSVSPDLGPLAGGTTVTITGTDLGAAEEVLFGDEPGTGLVVSPDGTSLTVVTPPGSAAGPVDVTVVLPGADAVLDEGFVYAAIDDGILDPEDVPPTLTDLDPASGPAEGGQLVALAGTGFTEDGTQVTFAGRAARMVAFVSPTALLAVTPEGSAGDAEVVVTVDGLSSDPLTYTYVAAVTDDGDDNGTDDGTDNGTDDGTDNGTDDGTDNGTDNGGDDGTDDGTDDDTVGPTITGVTPRSASTSGGTLVTVSGSGFVLGQSFVALCDVLMGPAQVGVAADGTTLTFRTPSCSPGVETLTVHTPDGQASTDFRFVASATTTANSTGYDRLASTGADTGSLVLLALVLLVAGAGLVLRTRRTGGAVRTAVAGAPAPGTGQVSRAGAPGLGVPTQRSGDGREVTP